MANYGLSLFYHFDNDLSRGFVHFCEKIFTPVLCGSFFIIESEPLNFERVELVYECGSLPLEVEHFCPSWLLLKNEKQCLERLF